MAYILGFITADGSVNKYSLRIELAIKDKDVLEFIRDEISPTKQITTCFKNEKEYCCLKIHSKKLIESLNKFNIVPNKTYNIRLDFNIPQEYLGDYLRGLFDGDGWVYCRRNSIECGIVSHEEIFLQQIKDIINNGVLRKRTKLTKKGLVSTQYVLDFYSNKTIKFRDLIYSNNGFCLKRKKDIFFSEFYKPAECLWREDQIEYLKNNFKPKTKGLLDQLANNLNKSRSAVSKKIWELQLVNNFK